MSEDPPSTLPGADAPPSTRPLPVLLNKNISPSPEQVQTQPQLFQGIKTMRLCFPHPSSLDILLSPNKKWSVTTHPIKGEIFGFIKSTISYHQFYFCQGRVLHAKAFAISTTTITVGNGGKPKGSTKLNDANGQNCAMTKKEYVTLFSTPRHSLPAPPQQPLAMVANRRGTLSLMMPWA